MSKIVLLDSGPLGMISHPRNYPEIKIWLANLLRSGTNVKIPEIADYEVRRELKFSILHDLNLRLYINRYMMPCFCKNFGNATSASYIPK